MTHLISLVWKEKHEYYSYKSVDEIRSDIKTTLDKSKGWDFSLNMTGGFISDNEFEITPKWSFAVIKNYERDLAYLRGQLLSHNNGTKVRFTIRPNSAFLILSIAFPIFGLISLIAGGTRNSEVMVVGLAFTFVVPLTTLTMAYFSKQGLKNRFIRIFELQPITGKG